MLTPIYDRPLTRPTSTGSIYTKNRTNIYRDPCDTINIDSTTIPRTAWCERQGVVEATPEMEDHRFGGLVLREAKPSDRERCGTSTEENVRRCLSPCERKRGYTKRMTNSGVPIGRLSWRHILTGWRATPAAPIEGLSGIQKWTNRRTTPGVPIEGVSLLQK